MTNSTGLSPFSSTKTNFPGATSLTISHPSAVRTTSDAKTCVEQFLVFPYAMD